MPLSPADPRVSDLATFLAVGRTGSITSAARELEVTPSQVSKSVKRLEHCCGAKLLRRGARGVSLTDAGKRLVPSCAALVSALRGPNAVAPPPEGRISLTVAGPSYLVGYLLPPTARAHRGLYVRGLELSPAHLRAYVTEGIFEAAFVPGDVEASAAGWTKDRIGDVRATLLGAPRLAKSLGPAPVPVERLRGLGFVSPTSTAGDRFVTLSDHCPLAAHDRKTVHEAQTIGAALELAASGDEVVFGPVVAARHFLATGKLVEIPVEGWDVRQPLHLLCNGNVVRESVRRAVVVATSRAMAAIGP